MEDQRWHLAQINIGKMLGMTINDPVMAGFVAQLDEINALAERHPGFIWRLKDDSNNATNLNPFNDDRIIVNMSVWASVKQLEDYVYNSAHREVLKKRREWFTRMERPFMVLWYVPEGHLPTVEEAKERILHLENNGPTPFAFTFRQQFPAPDEG